MVVPGSGLVKAQAEAEGLDRIFRDAGFEWREPGCSMCLAMNDDRLEPGERCASTSNRNFEGRQGAGGRTHLVSPAMAAAAADRRAFRRRASAVLVRGRTRHAEEDSRSLVVMIGFAVAASAACNTVEGVGKDVKAGGQAIENAADKSKPK